MKKLFTLFVTSILLLGVFLSSCKNSNSINTADNPTDYHSSAASEIQTTSPTIEATTNTPTAQSLPTAEDMRLEIENQPDMLRKLSLISSLYEEHPDISLPVVKEFINGLDFTVAENIQYYFRPDFDALLIALYNDGERSFYEDTLIRVFDTVEDRDKDWVFGLLENEDTYLTTALIALGHGHLENDPFFLGILLNYGYESFVFKHDTLDGELSAVNELAEQVFPLVPLLYESDVNYVYEDYYSPVNGSENARRDFASYMPPLSNDSAQPVENVKCLVVFRNIKEDELENWYLDLRFMPALPVDNMPENLDEVNTLVTVDTKWEYAFDYTVGMKAYKAVSDISVFDYPTGHLIRSLGECATAPPTVYHYFGERPEAVYATTSDYGHRMSMSEKINAYLSGEIN